MANPKTLTAYPREFHSMVAQLAAEGTFTPLEFTCTSLTNAQTRRNFLSGFRTALRRAAETAQTPDLAQQAQHRYELSKQIRTSTSVDPSGAVILRIHPKESPEWIRGKVPFTPGVADPNWEGGKNYLRNETPTTGGVADAIDEAADLASHQIASLIKHWGVRLVTDPAWYTANSPRAKLLVLQQPHMAETDVSISPLLEEPPRPLDETGC